MYLFIPESPLAGCSGDWFETPTNISRIAADLGDLEAVPETIDVCTRHPILQECLYFI